MSEPPLTQPAPWAPPALLPDNLESERLLIRMWTLDDAPALLAAIDASRETLLPWLPWAATDHRTIEDTIYNIVRFKRSMVGPDVDGCVYGIFDRATGEVLGGTGWNRGDRATHVAETGYWVRHDRRGQGIATEATARNMSTLFTPQDQGGWGFRRVVIYCSAANKSSRRVPEKLGLRQETTARLGRWIDGIGYTDDLGWGVLADEWDSATHRRR